MAHQSELSIAVAAVFLAGCTFATLTSILFPPPELLSWPNPLVVAVATSLAVIVVAVRGHRMRRTTAAWLTGGFAVFLIATAGAIQDINRATVGGMLIVCVVLVFAWFMPASLARAVGYTSLAAYGIVMLLNYPGNGTILLVVSLCVLAVLLLEIFGRFKRALQRSSLTDHLCQVWNRGGFDLLLQKEIRVAGRSRAPLSLLYLDLDGFKAINDAQGHLVGDEVLQEVSRSLKHSLRGADTVARIGGDEFVLILPATGFEEARALGVRLREEVTACEWTFGVAEYHAGETALQFTERSDIELLKRKRARALQRQTIAAAEEAPSRASRPAKAFGQPASTGPLPVVPG